MVYSLHNTCCTTSCRINRSKWSISPVRVINAHSQVVKEPSAQNVRRRLREDAAFLGGCCSRRRWDIDGVFYAIAVTCVTCTPTHTSSLVSTQHTQRACSLSAQLTQSSESTSPIACVFDSLAIRFDSLILIDWFIYSTWWSAHAERFQVRP